MKHSPWAAISEFHGGEEDSVEVDVVFAHELEEADIIVVEPPLFPLWGIVRGNTRVAQRRIELGTTERVIMRG